MTGLLRLAAKYPIRRRAALVGIRSAFVAWVVVSSWNQPAWDLTATSVAGRLMRAGQVAHLYDQTLANAASIPGSAWSREADAGGIHDHVVTPYIQTPLWAWLVAPLASATDFSCFKRIFSALSALSIAAAIAVAAFQWAPSLAGPIGQAGLLFGICLTVPFETSFILGQTQPIFLLLSVLAAASALRGRPVTAGIMLALATFVKLTPGFLTLAWLVSGRKKPCASFVVSFGLLTLLTIIVSSADAFESYLATLKRLGSTLLLSFNNDSLATVLLSNRLTDATAFRFVATPLPAWIAVVSVGATCAAAIIAGLLDRRSSCAADQQIGAVFVLVAATAFTPLAWNHYFLVLVLPVMAFLQAALLRRSRAWLALACCIVILNVPPIAYTIGRPLGVVAYRSHFWAAILCLCALPFVRRPAEDVRLLAQG